MVDNLTWGATTGAQSGGIGALGSLSQNGVSVGRSMGEIGAQEMMAQNLYRSQTQAYQDLISAGAAASSVPKPVQERAIGSAEEYNQKARAYASRLPQQNTLPDALKDLQSQASKYGIKLSLPTYPRAALFDSKQANSILANYTKALNTALAKQPAVSSSLTKQGTQKSLSHGNGAANSTKSYQGSSTTAKAITAKQGITSTTTTATKPATTTTKATTPTKTTTTTTATAPKATTTPTQPTDKYSVNSYGLTSAEWADYQKTIHGWFGNTDASGNAIQGSVEYYKWAETVQGAKPPLGTAVNGAFKVSGSSLASSTTIDPQKTSGYKFANALNDDNSSRFLKAQISNPSLTELQWRQTNVGRDNGGSPVDTVTMTGNYSKPAVVGNDYNSGNKSAISNPTVLKIVTDNLKLTNSVIASNLAAQVQTKPTVVSAKTTTTAELNDRYTNQQLGRSLGTTINKVATANAAVNKIITADSHLTTSQIMNKGSPVVDNRLKTTQGVGTTEAQYQARENTPTTKDSTFVPFGEELAGLTHVYNDLSNMGHDAVNDIETKVSNTVNPLLDNPTVRSALNTIISDAQAMKDRTVTNINAMGNAPSVVYNSAKDLYNAEKNVYTNIANAVITPGMRDITTQYLDNTDKTIKGIEKIINDSQPMQDLKVFGNQYISNTEKTVSGLGKVINDGIVKPLEKVGNQYISNTERTVSGIYDKSGIKAALDKTDIPASIQYLSNPGNALKTAGQVLDAANTFERNSGMTFDNVTTNASMGLTKVLSPLTKIIDGVAALSPVTGWAKAQVKAFDEAPVTEIGKAVIIGAAGAGLGAGIELGSDLVGNALVRTSTSAIVRDLGVLSDVNVSGALRYAGTHFKQGLNLWMMKDAGTQGYDTVKQGDIGKDLDFLKNVGLGISGYKTGEEIGARAFDRVREIGGKEVPITDIVGNNVLSGKDRFPEVPKGKTANDVVKMFEDKTTGERYGYHASPGPITDIVGGKGGVAARSLDNPGMYIAPQGVGASPYFTRIGADSSMERGPLSSIFSDLKVLKDTVTDYQEGKIRKAGLIKELKKTPGKVVTSILGTPGLNEPSINRINLDSEVLRMPRDIRYDLKASQEQGLLQPTGRATTTWKLEKGTKGAQGGAEAEAVITPGTRLEPVETEKQYTYYTHNGSTRLIDLKTWNAIEDSEIGKNTDIAKDTKILKEKPLNEKPLNEKPSNEKPSSRGVKEEPKNSTTKVEKSTKPANTNIETKPQDEERSYDEYKSGVKPGAYTSIKDYGATVGKVLDPIMKDSNYLRSSGVVVKDNIPLSSKPSSSSSGSKPSSSSSGSKPSSSSSGSKPSSSSSGSKPSSSSSGSKPSSSSSGSKPSSSSSSTSSSSSSSSSSNTVSSSIREISKDISVLSSSGNSKSRSSSSYIPKKKTAVESSSLKKQLDRQFKKEMASIRSSRLIVNSLGTLF